MKLTPKIHQAITIATQLHLEMKRKGDDLPYIIHPYSVAFILANYTEDEDIVVAGLLHDVLEDVVGYSAEDIRSTFGERVLGIVQEVSEDKDPRDSEEKGKKTWKERKVKYIAHLEKASFEALMVSCADKIHNLRSTILGYEKQGEKHWERFNASREETLWFYREVLRVIRARLDNDIVDELSETFSEVEAIIESAK